MPALQGFIVEWPFATPTIGLSKSPSPKPTARSIARLGERATPWVMSWLRRSRGQDWLRITDFVTSLAPLALGAGRLGNFINAELWGRPTDVPWAMIFPNVDRVPRHPSQLYELALEGVLLFLILWWSIR
jgi:prolipoprotein diacylglyceryltransferase